MSKINIVFGMLLVIGLCGCPSTRSATGTDSGIVIDFDVSPREDVPERIDVFSDDSPTPSPMCGNGQIEGGEECDDGNNQDGDGCSARCVREPHCGDGQLGHGEVCDDGNNLSGDGCRSDCLSNETCGNGRVDSHVGELCDGSSGCAMDCRSIAGCGNGMTDRGEECDDGNAMPWDGCGSDCREEVTFLLRRLQFAREEMGCDYTGDRRPDNRFAAALGSALPLLNRFLEGGGRVSFILALLGLDDPAGRNDPELRSAWLFGQPSGAGYLIDAASLDPELRPQTSIQSRIASSRLEGGPEDIELPIGFLPVRLEQAFVRASTEERGGRLVGLREGMVCGAIPVPLLSFLSASMLEMLGSAGGFRIEIGEPCDGSPEDPTFADMMIGGAMISIVRIRPQSPDVDLDGDGLERFEVVSTGAPGCQPVVRACIDGNGTRIEGRYCYNDSRIADGFSAALQFEGMRVSVNGVATR
ncbi:MAG: DUF4215 domain-containing protein [Sandaracinaceae bacterium]|nr:DUF4215 domain-containing protein [Sandaracinaceae bacterium]MDW8245020.1 DUF4215 domain-containing protein [Sandaracinaceae bacterium]